MAEQYFSAEPASKDVRRTLNVTLRGHEATAQVSNGVFSGSRVDLGTSVLLKHAPEPPLTGDFLDLGCGWGAIGVAVKKKYPAAHVTMVDVNRRALELCRFNAVRNGITAECLESDGMAEVMERKQKEYGTAIYLIADEPYRELAYDGVTVPYLTKYYDNTIVGYSYSKSLSLPGERIGYLVIPDEVDDFENVICAANVANRILGFVNAPSLMQLAVAKCLEEQTDVAAYDTNRKMLLDALTEYGYEVVKPEGAFYLWVKTMEEDDTAFVARAKEYNLLVVPGSSFMCPGYVRIAYCVDPEMIKRSLPAFEKLAQSYQ